MLCLQFSLVYSIGVDKCRKLDVFKIDYTLDLLPHLMLWTCGVFFQVLSNLLERWRIVKTRTRSELHTVPQHIPQKVNVHVVVGNFLLESLVGPLPGL